MVGERERNATQRDAMRRTERSNLSNLAFVNVKRNWMNRKSTKRVQNEWPSLAIVVR